MTVAKDTAAASPGSDATPATTTGDVQDTAARLALVVGRINRHIRARGDGLSYGLVSAVATVVRHGPIRPGDLARAESVAPPTMTRLIAELESRGLLIRRPDPADGRSFFVEATEAGVHAVRRAQSERARFVAELLESLSEEDRGRVDAALDALEAAVTAPNQAEVLPPVR